MNIVKKAKLAHIVICVGQCLVGLALLVWPQASPDVARCLVGSIFVLLGASKLIGYFSNDIYRLAFQFDLALGIFGCSALAWNRTDFRVISRCSRLLCHRRQSL